MDTERAHFTLQFDIVQRSKNQDARKISAYGLCGKLAADDKFFDFTHKTAEHAGHAVLLPDGAPPWAGDPQQLWNHAEAAERRGDAQPARVMMFTIPRDVPPDQRLAFARHVLEPFRQQGMAIQIDVHAPPATDGGEQPHVHCVMTMRRFSGDQFAPTKAREWNALFRDGKGIRRLVAGRTNEWLAANGIAARVDPERHGGPKETRLPRHHWENLKTTGQQSPELAAILADREAKAVGAEAEQLTARLRRRHETAWRRALAAYRADLAATRQAARPDRRAASQAAAEAMRQRHRQEREQLFRTTRPGAARDRQKASLEQRQAAERATVRAADLFERWTQPPRPPTPSFESWINQKANQGDDLASLVQIQQQRRRARAARIDPVAAARAEIAREIEEIQRRERAAPRAEHEPYSGFSRASVSLTLRQKAAAEAAAAADQAAREYARQNSIFGLMLGRERVAEHRRLKAAAATAARKAAFAETARQHDLRALSDAAIRAAEANQAAQAAWRTEANSLIARRARAEAALVAVAAGDEAAIEAAARGDMRTAAEAARAWQAQQAEASQAEGRQAPGQPPERAAFRNLLAAEQQAIDQQEAQAIRAATRAAAMGDPATVQAAAAGDTQAAMEAAEAWEARRREDEIRRIQAARARARQQEARATAGPRGP